MEIFNNFDIKIYSSNLYELNYIMAQNGHRIRQGWMHKFLRMWYFVKNFSTILIELIYSFFFFYTVICIISVTSKRLLWQGSCLARFSVCGRGKGTKSFSLSKRLAQPKFLPASCCNLDWFQSWTTKQDRRALADPLRLYSAILFSMDCVPSTSSPRIPTSRIGNGPFKSLNTIFKQKLIYTDSVLHPETRKYWNSFHISCSNFFV